MGDARTNCFVLCLMFVSMMIFSGVCLAAADASSNRLAAVDETNAFYSRIMNILGNREPNAEYLPRIANETAIFGSAELTQDQIVRFILRHNSTPRLTVPVEELVDYYYQEAAMEGIRPDVAVAQAILETGYFRFGGDVLPEQNNFAGLGTLGNGVRGATFDSARMGVRAHIQHLLAYAAKHDPTTPITDPRYNVVRQMSRYSGQCQTWESLSGRWAVPGVNYGQQILKIVDCVKNSQ
ncbi:MAG: Mannosyl-glycoprotein endo-beta-N-acetylglucosamidase [Firmicutes bacterium]|nr:Mannosyl-glycoprotein endo-beta-N-acetylglucosamidase [Bacillota bacterium]